MNTEANTITETAPTQTSKAKKAKKNATKAGGAKSKAAAKKSTKVKGGPKQAKPDKQPKSERVTKTTTVLELLRRKEGATIADIAKATGWQNHSIRGVLSGTVTKKMGLAVESSKNEAANRVYRID